MRKLYKGPERRQDPEKPFVVMWTAYPGAIINKNSIVDFWTQEERDAWITKMLKRYPNAQISMGLRAA